MPLERPFRVSLLVLVATGMLAITLAVGSVLWLLGSLAAFAALLLLTTARPAWHLSRVCATVAVLVTAQVVLLEWLFTGALLVPAAHFLIATQLVWLTQERNNRHYGWLCLMSLLQMMLAGVLSVDLGFGLCFLVYLPAGVLTLLLYSLRCELERQGQLTPSRMPRLGVRLFVGAGLVTLAELALSVVVFMYFPRFGIQILQLKPVQRGRRLSGFSDRVRFGELARVLDNPEVVMSVRLLQDGRPVRADTFPLRFRGISLDHYEHATWTTRDYMAYLGLYPLPFRPGARDRDREGEIVQDIALEPVNTRVLFYLSDLVRLDTATPNLEEVFYHRQSGAVSSVRSNAVSLHYVVRSRIPEWHVRDLARPAAQPLDHYDPTGRYTQLPVSITGRTRQLAEQIVRGVPELNVYDRAKTVEVYLKARYRYSRETGVHAPGVDPVEDFLCRAKAGHCEYFAAAMVVLLRSVGVPSRVVTGFRGGEWNDYGQFYIVRQRNAHAWVEVFVPAVDTWVTFDPTPSSPSTASFSQGWLGNASRRLAYLRLWWNNNVVNFSSGDQRKLVGAATALLSRLPGYLPVWGRERLALDSGWAAGAGAAMVLAVLVMLAGGWAALSRLLGWRVPLEWLWRRRRRRGEPGVGFYRRLTDLLRRRGFRRSPSATPREFAHAVIDAGGAPAEPVELVTEAFCRVRYGGVRLSAHERHEVHRALAELERKRR